MDDGTLRIDAASARQLVLVQAVEDIDTQGKLVSAVERDQAEREALAASRGPADGELDVAAYLQQRARRLLAIVENRNPQLAGLQDPEPWRRWLPWALPLAACVLGAAIDRIDNPQRVNMLSPPLLGVLFWNLAMYLVLIGAWFLPRRWQGQGVLAVLQRWLSGVPANGRRTGRLRTDVAARFHRQWLQATGRQQLLWGRQVLHLTAAGWALGMAVSIVLGGLVRQYRVGWESTLLDLGQVHGFLSVLFAPVVALLPFEAFSTADLQRMAFSSGALVGVDEARRWVWMYLALLFLLVVLPRMVLAAWAAWRRQGLAREVRLDLRDPYFVQVLARVSPARITVAISGADSGARALLQRVLEQVADQPPAGRTPWPVLVTPKGDVLRVFDVPAGFQPPSVVTAPTAQGPSAAQAWLQDLVGRFRTSPAPAAGGRDAVAAALEDTDLLLLLPARIGELAGVTRLLQWLAQPSIVLVDSARQDDSLEAYRAELQRLGVAAEVRDLHDLAAHWLREPSLLAALAAGLPASQRAGFARVTTAWNERNEQRFRDAQHLLAQMLARAARDSEEVGVPPAGLRQLVNAGERQAGQRAREGAAQALLQRLRAQESATFASLLRLHRLAAPGAPVPGTRIDDDLVMQHAVDSPQAGMAGAATGAAMGAGIDLMTGGLTLGAAAALGAVIGGGAAYIGAALKNRSTGGGQPQVQLGDETLQTLTEAALLAYLAVAHRGSSGQAELPAAWRSEAVAAVAARREELAPLWSQARVDAEAAVQPLARQLEAMARGLLARL
jgi:hypothetical protein